MTEPTSLEGLTDELLASASRSQARRAARTVVGGHEHAMRQTVVALLAGAALADHETPGEATLLVLRGQVELSLHEESVRARAGEIVDIPPRRHSLLALEDAAVLLTANPREYMPKHETSAP